MSALNLTDKGCRERRTFVFCRAALCISGGIVSQSGGFTVTANFHEKLTPHPVYTVEKSDIMKMSACVPTGATPMIPGGILL